MTRHSLVPVSAEVAVDADEGFLTLARHGQVTVLAATGTDVRSRTRPSHHRGPAVCTISGSRLAYRLVNNTISPMLTIYQSLYSVTKNIPRSESVG